MTDDAKNICSLLIRKLIAAHGLKDSEFAKMLGLARQTISNYTTGKSEPNWSVLNDIIEQFKVNPAWLLTGNGEMFGSSSAPSSTLPADELNEKLTPAQREMLTYKRTMQELGASPERIIDGIEAIAMGRTCQTKSTTYTTAEPQAHPGYNNIHESGADFGSDI